MTKDIQRILCSIDFSDYSTPVLDCGAEMAQRFNAELIIFYTIASDDNRLYGPDILDHAGKLERLAAEAHSRIKAYMAPYKIAWEPVVVSGNPVEQICNVGRSRNVDLAIAASRGFSILKRAFMGSVVERMARSLPFPFLVLRFPGHIFRRTKLGPIKFKRIVVGCTFSEKSFSPVNMAVKLGEAYQSTVHLLHAVETPLNEKVVDSTRGPYTRVQEDLLEALKNQLSELIPRFNKNKCTIKPALIPGVPGEGLLTFAGSVDADLIVVGVLQHSTLGKILIGSTTEAALRHAPCPVLVVPGSASLESLDAKGIQKTGIVRDRSYLDHRPAPGHPESPERLAAVYDLLDTLDFQDQLVNIPPRPATRDELLLVHAPEYLDLLNATAGGETCALTADTHVSAGSCAAAHLAVGGLLEAITAVVAGDLANAFALVRPPGHHAETNRAMGYCLLNNIALGAMHARKVLGLQRVLLIDWDVHHGNGTQHVFEQDPTVLFFSIHQNPHFPGTGFFMETGRGPGEGYTANIPLPKGYGDGEYVFFLEHLLRPMALEFQPDLVIVSAGFDTHAKDQVGGMSMSAAGFAAMTRVVMDLSETCCAGKLVLTLEGGYHLDALTESINAVLLELTGQTVADINEIAARADKKKIDYVLKRFLPVQRRFWHNI